MRGGMRPNRGGEIGFGPCGPTLRASSFGGFTTSLFSAGRHKYRTTRGGSQRRISRIFRVRFRACFPVCFVFRRRRRPRSRSPVIAGATDRIPGPRYCQSSLQLWSWSYRKWWNDTTNAGGCATWEGGMGRVMQLHVYAVRSFAESDCSAHRSFAPHRALPRCVLRRVNDRAVAGAQRWYLSAFHAYPARYGRYFRSSSTCGLIQFRISPAGASQR